MADDPAGSLADSLLQAGPPSQETVAVAGPDDFAMRARQWFLEAYNHPLWQEYIKEGDEDIAFYVGGEGQWTKDSSTQDLQRLKSEHRTIVALNQIQAPIDLLVGFERQNRFDPRTIPQGDEDEDDARLMTWLLKWTSDQAEVPEVLSDGFEEGLIPGMSAFYVRTDWSKDVVQGKILVELLEPGKDVIWDPYWKGYDLSNDTTPAKYVIRFKRVWVDDLVAQYPTHKETILGAASKMDALYRGASAATTDGPAGDAFGSVLDPAQEGSGQDALFYDPKHRLALVMEVWYLDHDVVWLVSDKIQAKVREVDSEATADMAVAADRENLTKVRRLRRRIGMRTVLPAAYLTLDGAEDDDDSPYDNDKEHYPIVPYIARRKRDHIYGPVRNMKDPQRIGNKRVSQFMDILARYARARRVVVEGSLVNPADLEDESSTSPIRVKAGHESQRPTWDVPPLAEAVRLLSDAASEMKMANREIPGINTDMLGHKSDATSGIAIARRQSQGQIIATPFFDNFRRTRKLVYQRLARRVQQRFTLDEFVRLTNEQGEPVVLRLNPAEFRHLKDKDQIKAMRQEMAQAGKPHVLRDVSALKYDVIIADTPQTPSARAATLEILLQLVQIMPGIMPIVAPSIVALVDGLPNKAEILQGLQAMAAPPPGAGGPPPAGGAPLPAGATNGLPFTAAAAGMGA